MLKKTSLTIIMLTLLSVTMVPMVHAEEASIQVDPQISTVKVGEAFTVNVTVNDVTDLAVWEVQLYYLNTVLNCTNVAEGPFLKQGGNTFFASLVNNTYNTTHGRVLMGATLIGLIPGVNGSGTLGTVTFQAIGGGDTPLHLTATTLLDSTEPPRNPIPHTTIDGAVHVTGGAIHDVAVTNVTTSKTIVGQGYLLRINVTVENQGDVTESFNVTVFYNETAITLPNGKNHTTITLASLNSTTITLTWNTTGTTHGNYTISAYATPVLGETDTTDNTFTYGIITVTILGDVDGDFDVDIYDVVKITSIYGSKKSDPEFNPNSDLDDDDEITIYDVVRCTRHYGQKYP